MCQHINLLSAIQEKIFRLTDRVLEAQLSGNMKLADRLYVELNHLRTKRVNIVKHGMANTPEVYPKD